MTDIEVKHIEIALLFGKALMKLDEVFNEGFYEENKIFFQKLKTELNSNLDLIGHQYE